MRTWIWLVSGLATVGLVAAACTGGNGGDASLPEEVPSTGVTQSDGGEGGVTVQLTWLTATELGSDPALASAVTPHDSTSYLLVRVKMDTHSGDLNGYDLAASSGMVVDGGSPQAPLAWHPLSDNAHHREALLVFDRPQGAASVEITLKDLAGVPRRVFRWEPPPEA